MICVVFFGEIRKIAEKGIGTARRPVVGELCRLLLLLGPSPGFLARKLEVWLCRDNWWR